MGADVAVDTVVADGVSNIHVMLSVAMTIVLTSSVVAGVPMVAGRFSMVDDEEVEDPMIVAVMVLTVLGRDPGMLLQIL